MSRQKQLDGRRQMADTATAIVICKMGFRFWRQFDLSMGGVSENSLLSKHRSFCIVGGVCSCIRPAHQSPNQQNSDRSAALQLVWIVCRRQLRRGVDQRQPEY